MARGRKKAVEDVADWMGFGGVDECWLEQKLEADVPKLSVQVILQVLASSMWPFRDIWAMTLISPGERTE